MTTSKKIKELKDRESRQFFYEEHIETGLPIQLRELRKKRKLTQKELAELTGFDQSNISDWENPNYEYTPQISTLQRFANAFDVPLIVRFGSWDELLEWDNNLSPEKVAPESFDEFAEKVEKEEIKDKVQETGKVLVYPKVVIKPEPLTDVKEPIHAVYSEPVTTFKLIKNPSPQTKPQLELPFSNLGVVSAEPYAITLESEQLNVEINEDKDIYTTGKAYAKASGGTT